MSTENRQSKFALKMRKINRGVVLGIIIVVVWLIYIIVTQVRFKNSTQSIEGDAESFLNDFYKAAETDIDNVWSNEDKSSQIKEIEDVCDKYWTDKTLFTDENSINSLDMSYCLENKTQFVNRNTEIYEDEVYAGNVTDVKVDVDHPKVRKYGDSGAVYTATVTVSGNVPKYQQFPTISKEDGNSATNLFGDYETEELYEKEYNAKKNKGYVIDASINMTITYQVELFYRYTEGQWKISDCMNYYEGFSSTENDDTKQYAYSTDTNDAKNEDNQTPLNGEEADKTGGQ